MKAPSELMLSANDVETLWALDPLIEINPEDFTTVSNGELLGLIEGVTSHSAVSRRIGRLKTRGLVDVAYSNDTGRSRRYITLTDSGRKALDLIAQYQ